MPAVDARFISLADALRGRSFSASEPANPAGETPRAPLVSEPAPAATSKAPPVTLAAQPLPVALALDDVERSLALREARLFRAALGDAFDAELAGLVRRLAVDIVARELRLSAVDIAVLARRLITEWEAAEPLRLRVAATDGNVVCVLPVVVDAALEAGDAILECRSGSIDARLGVRLAAVLEAVTP